MTTSVFEYERDAVRVKARFNNPSQNPQEANRKFSVDPNLTSYETLRNLLSRAFDLPQDAFKLYYQYTDDEWFPLLSDWDLDAAIISASEPCLQLELISFRTSTSSEAESEPAGTSPDSLPLKNAEESEKPSSSLHFLPSPEAIQSMVTTSNKASMGFFSKHYNQTIPALTKKIHKALAIEDGPTSPSKLVKSASSSPIKTPNARPPLSDKEFRSYLDNVGELVRPKEFRLAIYQGGVEPQLRKVVWKHLLGVYPMGMNGKERLDYMKQKSAQYESLKSDWTSLVVQGKIKCCSEKAAEELKTITNMVRKDVLRTDRHHKFYAGEGNSNVTCLFNILTTFALNHPSVSYCQGMSDLLSPLLVTMMDESHAYVTFCAMMQRLKSNFFLDGVSMTKKFQHLTDGLLYYDPEFYTFLKLNQADDLLFCYRWLLLEMKREFDFENCFKVLEVLWSSLPPSYPEKPDGLKLFEKKFSSTEELPAAGPSLETPPRKLTAYSRLANLRRQASSNSSIESPQRRLERMAGKKPKPHLKDARPRIRSMGSSSPSKGDSKGLMVKSQSLLSPERETDMSPQKHVRKITDFKDFKKFAGRRKKRTDDGTDEDVENLELDDDDEVIKNTLDDDDDTVGYSHFNCVKAPPQSDPRTPLTLVCNKLPEPIEFGDGNPFLIFLCIACILQHRTHIMKQGYDYQEIAMYFDRMVRKHDVERTLSISRKLFAEYLNDSWASTDSENADKKDVNGKANC